MNLMELAIKVGVEDEATDKLGSISSGVIAKGVAVGNAMWDITKAAAGAMGNAVSSIVTGATEAYSNFEQLSGGVAKLYGNAGQSLEEYAAANRKTADEVRGVWERNQAAQVTVFKNASEAYKTAGMSANQYMEQATSFSAALINSLGGDTKRAADMTDVAMRAMSDNINTFGSNAEDVSNAFNGFAKQNYTMLDNLKLGYGGTKSEMERLIKDANEWGAANGEASDLSIDSFADVVQAIQQVQEKQQIAGTTAREAATTVEGSVNTMKAAWENWLAGLSGAGDEDMGTLTSQLIDSVTTVIQNVAPVIGTIAGTIVSELPGMVEQVAGAIPGMLGSVTQAISDSLGIDVDLSPIEEKFSQLGSLIESTFGSHDYLAPLQEGFDSLAQAGQSLMDMLGGLDLSGLFDGAAQGVENFLGYLQPAGDVLSSVFSNPEVQSAMQTLLDVMGQLAEVAGSVLGAALLALVYIFGSLVEGVSMVVNAISGLVSAIVQFFTGDIPNAGNALLGFFAGLPGSIAGFLDGVISVVASWVGEMASQAMQAGSQFLSNIASFFGQLPGQIGAFLSAAISAIASWVGQVASNAVQAGTQFINNIRNFFSQLPSTISGFLSSALSALASFVSQVGARAVQAGQSFLNGIRGGFNAAVSFVASIPGRIVGALGNLGGLLVGAGRSIMDGLRNGIVAGFQSVASYVSGIAGRIASLKGPLPYDRILLVPNGEAIMSGLLGGIEQGFGPVEDYVSSMAGRMRDAFGAPVLSAQAIGGQAALAATGGGTTYNAYFGDVTVSATSREDFADNLYDVLSEWEGDAKT